MCGCAMMWRRGGGVEWCDMFKEWRCGGEDVGGMVVLWCGGEEEEWSGVTC